MKYLIPFTLFLTGCLTAVHTTKLKSYPAKSEKCKIDVFRHKTPDKKFEEIAFLSKSGIFLTLPELKKKACLVGGDAIIFSKQTIGSITAIKYTE